MKLEVCTAEFCEVKGCGPLEAQSIGLVGQAAAGRSGAGGIGSHGRSQGGGVPCFGVGMPVAAHVGPLSRGVARSTRCTDQLLKIKGSAALGRVRIKTKFIGTCPSPLVGQVALEAKSAQGQLNASSDLSRVRIHRGVGRPTLRAGFFDESEGIIALNLNDLATGGKDSGAQEG